MTAGEQTKLAVVKFYRYLKEHDLINIVLIVNLIHDEILIECPIELSDSMAKLLQQCMEEAAAVYCKIIPLGATPVIDTHWEH